ncbi:MAG TPA: hypothetical protein VMH24_05470 [Candidatus Sulfotelmatobacter sp.]|nr:hypothetical protein [Candidatus Sulfotelmatobacter sp.]
MLPTLLLVIGLALIACGLLLLAGSGRAYRVGRVLAAAPLVPITTAVELARAGEPRYVRVHGRITSAEEFPDEHDRPLVYRHRRLELRAAGRWQDVWQEREAVPFGVEQRAAFIGVDAARLEQGLVVIPRESRGRAGEVPEHLPAGTDPATPARYRVDQISAVEQADVAGQPVTGPDGTALMTAGLGRPLILSTLEQAEAMRILGAGHIGRLRLAAACLAAGVLSLAAALLVAVTAWTLAGSTFVPVVRAASPTQPAAVASPAVAPSPVPSPADTRSSGVGPGLVGQPFLALLGVVGVGALAVAVAAGYARLAAAREAATEDEGPDTSRDPR